MYSVVLAAVLTTGGAAPDWHFGCCGCCGGCTGNAFSCYGCSGGCYGCCGGCCGGYYAPAYYGCCGGCHGGYYGPACYGCSGWTCYGSYVYSSYNFYSCSGCTGCWGSCYGTYGTYIGGWGAVVVPAAPVKVVVPVDTDKPKPPKTKPETSAPRPGGTATVTVLLPEDTRLYVDDVPYPTMQEKVTFETPALAAERTYYYTLKAEVVRDGKVVHRESRRVDVAAGKEVKVEFSSLAAVDAGRR